MIKKYKSTLIASSIVTLLPLLAGVIFWDKLPSVFPTHWGFNGEANGYSGKVYVFVVMPLIMLALQWLGVLLTSFDKRSKEQSKKALTLAFWIVPVISIFVTGIMVAVSMGWTFSVQYVTFLLLGVVFILVGNYLPKCRLNYTLGIKIKWTLENEENWNFTHRVVGKIWVLCGISCLFGIFLPEKMIPVALLIILLPTAVVPVLISYIYYRKQLKKGAYTKNQAETNFTKGGKIAVTIIITVIVIVLAVVLFTGDVYVEMNENSLKLSATYWQATEISYDEIKEIEYRESFDAGNKAGGFDSLRLQLGSFTNNEFGLYGIYKYTGSQSAIVLKNNRDGVIVISADTTENTKALYEELSVKIK